MTGSRIFLVTAAMVLAVSGCGADDTADPSTTRAETTAAPAQTTQTPTTQIPTTQTPTTQSLTTQTPTTGAPGTSTPGTTAADGGTVVAVADTHLGTVLVDGEGLTLYLFGLDEAGVSSCVGSCAESWPPVAAPASAGDGVDATLLGTALRDDGVGQVTYDGHPLYRFAGDRQPGDTIGQGINDVWYVVSPTGEPVTGAAVGEGVDDY